MSYKYLVRFVQEAQGLRPLRLVADAHPVPMPLVEVVAASNARPRRAERVRAVQDVVQLLTSPALEKDHEI